MISNHTVTSSEAEKGCRRNISSTHFGKHTSVKEIIMSKCSSTKKNTASVPK